MSVELQKLCALCPAPLTPGNYSLEHAIPQAIGGWLKVKGFICKSCNETSGHSWDAVLCAQLQPLCLLFDIVREQGKVPALQIKTTAGEDLLMHPGGKLTPATPTFSKERLDAGYRIEITARSMAEAGRMLAGISRKHRNVDVEAELKKAQLSSGYPKGMVHHQLGIGGERAGRSVVKSGLCIAHYGGIAADACIDALAYLRPGGGEPCFGYYYATDLIRDRPPEVPLHCVAVDANPRSGLILGYVEYFGAFRAVICLGREYAGAPISSCYAVDPRTGTPLELSVELPFNYDQIREIYDYKMIPDGAMAEAFAQVIPAALRKKQQNELRRVIEEAVKFAFANCGAKPGEFLTPAHKSKIAALMAERLTPFMLRIWAQGQLSPPK